MRIYFKNIFVALLLVIVIVPIFVSAQNSEPPIVSVECGVTQPDGSVNRECGYDDLLQLVNRIINWIIMISVPVAAGVFAWAGIQYMITGVADKKAAAKAMLLKVFIGFVAILAAWIIVTTILNALLSQEIRGDIPIEGIAG
jgi:hypothetical protein